MSLNMEELSTRFTWVDYLVFAIMLALSAAIGVFYGCFGKKQTNTKEFLMAGKSMTAFPVAMSLIASFMSAITLLGTPSEIYQFGSVYWLIGFSYILVTLGAIFLYVPVFWELQVTSAYEYLERRFSLPVRMLGSLIFIIQMVLYMAIVVYAPALALAQVTGINVYLSVCLICFVCMFYTTLGGMKAVLWTDTIQVLIMYLAMGVVIVKGTIDVGGISYIWQKNIEGGRVELVNWDPNPGTRHTIWSLVIGGYFTWITIYGVNQAQVQRYLCVQEKKMARNALIINLIGLWILMLSCSFCGMIIYARYWDCDPVRSGVVNKGDQLFPLFVMEILGEWSGLPGVFVAGIFAGALSTVSSGMNSLAAITLEDFIKGGCYPNISDKAATKISKMLTVFYGLLCFGLVFVAERLGNILSAALSIFGMVGGPLLGVFSLGMFFPWANALGAFIGTVSSLVFMFWIGVGHHVSLYNKDIILPKKLTSIDGCSFSGNYSLPQSDPVIETENGAMSLYYLSYMWYSATGCWTVIIVGLLISVVTGFQDLKKLDPATLSPGFHWVKRLIPGTDVIGMEYKGEKNTLEENKRSASLGEVNYAFNEQLNFKIPSNVANGRDCSRL